MKIEIQLDSKEAVLIKEACTCLANWIETDYVEFSAEDLKKDGLPFNTLNNDTGDKVKQLRKLAQLFSESNKNDLYTPA